MDLCKESFVTENSFTALWYASMEFGRNTLNPNQINFYAIQFDEKYIQSIWQLSS